MELKYVTGFIGIILASSFAQAQDNPIGVMGNNYSAGLLIGSSIEKIAQEYSEPKSLIKRGISEDRNTTVGLEDLSQKFSVGAQVCLDSDYSGCNSHAGVYFNKNLIGMKYNKKNFSLGAGYVRNTNRGNNKNQKNKKFFGLVIEYKH